MMLLPSGRAQGFATETLIAVLAHAFAKLPFDEVWVRFAVDHAAAERLPCAAAWCDTPELRRHATPRPNSVALVGLPGSWRRLSGVLCTAWLPTPELSA